MHTHTEPEPEPQDLGQNSAQLLQMFHHFLHAQQQLPPNQGTCLWRKKLLQYTFDILHP